MQDQQHRSDPDSFLMGSAPAAKFETTGTTVTGTITVKPEVRQQVDYDTNEPLFWPDGNPREQLVVTIQTDQNDPEIPGDDGERSLYIKGGMKTAVTAAVKAARAKGLAVGGVLEVTYVKDGPKTNPKFKPPKVYAAVYHPPTEAVAVPADPHPSVAKAPAGTVPPPF